MIDLWKGIANTWDCDEMGHMNVRVYVEKAFEGLGTLAGHCHLSHAYQENAPSTLVPIEQHIRFMREVHPGRPLSMTGCVLDVDETTVTVYQQLNHGDGSVAAAFRTRLQHAASHDGKAFAWSKRTREALEALKATPPKETAPRGLDVHAEPLPDSEVSKAVADAQGVKTAGLGMVPQQHCDVFGRMIPSWFIGRVSDAVPNLLYDWRLKVAGGEGGKRMGAAVLEYRLIYRRWPKPGDRFEIRTAFSSAQEKTHSLVHWMLDPQSGRPWMTSQAVAVTFDLDTRKAMSTPKDLMDDLARIAPGKIAL